MSRDDLCPCVGLLNVCVLTLGLAPYRRWGGDPVSADLRLTSGRPNTTSPQLVLRIEPCRIGGAFF